MLLKFRRKQLWKLAGRAAANFPYQPEDTNMFIDCFGSSLLTSKALEMTERKDGKFSIGIWWNKIASKRLSVY